MKVDASMSQRFSQFLKHDQTIAAAISIFFVVTYAQVNFRILPLIDSILYPLGQQGNLPYRDYYFPVTPGTYFLTQFAYWLPGDQNLYTFRLLGLLFLPLLSYSAYFVSRKFSGQGIAILMSAIAVGSFFSLGLEMLGGWNLIPIAFNFAGLTLIILAIVEEDLKRCKIAKIEISQNFLRLFLAGFLFSLAVLFKQTHLIQLILQVMIWWILMRFVLGKKVTERVFTTKNAIAIVLGASVTALSLFAWLVSNNIVNDFLNNMVSFGGKSPTITSLFGVIFEQVTLLLTSFLPMIFLLLILISAVFLDKAKLEIALPLFIILAFQFSYFLLWQSSSLEYVPILWISAASLLISVMSIYKFCSKESKQLWLSLSWFVFISIQSSYLVLNSEYLFKGLALLNFSEKLLVGFSYTLSIYVVLSLLLKHKDQDRQEVTDFYSQNFTTDRWNTVALLAIAGVFSELVNLLSSGGQIYFIWVMPFLIVLFQVFVSQSTASFRFELFSIPYAVLFLTSIGLFAQGTITPYSWWGWREPTLLKPSVSSSIEVFKGLSPESSVETFYVDLAKLEIAAASRSKNEDPTVLSLGNIPMATSVSGLRPYSSHYCRVQWFDLCPDGVLERDLETLKINPPDVIVFAEITPAAFSVHESLFLHGPSELRRFRDWRYQQVRQGNWVEVGKVRTIGSYADRISGGSRWTVRVYAVNK